MFFPAMRGNSFGWHITKYFNKTPKNSMYTTFRIMNDDYKIFVAESAQNSTDLHRGYQITQTIGGLAYMKPFYFMAGLGLSHSNHEVTQNINGALPIPKTVSNETRNQLLLEFKIGVRF
jgi:hypothetical protein